MADLIVLCPGALVAPVGMRSGSPPAWPRWLSHARQAARHDDPHLVPSELPQEAWLRRFFERDPAGTVEAATAHHDGLAADLPLWRLTPVHLRLGVDHLVLDDPQHLGLSPDHAARLAQAVHDLFAQAGFALLAPIPERWYLRGDRMPDWAARGWRMAVGRNIDAYSPQGTDARLWRSLVTQVQMTWHDHAVNQERGAAGLAPVNSLWLDGLCPPQRPGSGNRGGGRSRATQVISDDPALLGLAAAAAGPAPVALAVPPAAAAELSQQVRSMTQPGVDLLLVSSAWRDAERDGSDETWRSAWQQFDQWLGTICPQGRPPAGYDRLRLVLSGDRRWVELDLLPGWRWPWARRFTLEPVLESRNA